MEKIKLYIVSHKKCNPYIDNIREIIKVGNDINFDSKIIDNTGDNISYKNSSYCELTAMYWIWKNDNYSDILGIEHYRRQFISSDFQLFKTKYLDEEEIKKILTKYDAIVAKKWYTKKKNLNEAIKLSDNHKYEDFIILENVMKKYHKDYYKIYKKIMNEEKGFNPFNMIICNKSLYNKYCKWLFQIMSEVEEKIDTSKREGNLKRVFGYMSEILLSVWLEKNNIKYYENNVILNDSNCMKNFIRRQKCNIRNFFNK